jgi:hypothetical protein
MSNNDETYQDLLKLIPPISHRRMLHGEWLPEKGIEDVSNEDLYTVMKRTGKTYLEAQQMIYDEVQFVLRD